MLHKPNISVGGKISLTCFQCKIDCVIYPKGTRQNSPQQDDKTMLGNIGDLFVKFTGQVTKGHFYHLLGVSDYHVMYRHRAQSVL